MNKNDNKQIPYRSCAEEVIDTMKCTHKKCSDKKSHKKCVHMGGNEMDIWMLSRVGKQPFNPMKKHMLCANLQQLTLNKPVK